ncbi:MAG: DUF2029 domain-containing protein [Planctomycetes bacterium]|nr:DUF2029 domain-containing protein [Planctomycetota bacterium]
MDRSRLWLLPLLLAVMVAGGWYFGFRAKADDRELPVYVTGAERMVAGEEIYRRGTDAKPFTYPPFAAVPFVPFIHLPPDWQPPVWFAVNFAILLAVLRWLHRAGNDPGDGRARAVRFWLVSAALGAHHVTSVFTNQSHDLLILGTVTLVAAAWCRGRATAGVWAAAGAAIKATPLLFVGLFALRLRVGTLVVMAVALAALSLVPDQVWPRTDGRSWLMAWYEINLRSLQVGGTADAAGAWNPHSVLNQSLSGTLMRLLTAVQQPGKFVEEGVALAELTPGTFRLVSLAAQAGVLVLIAWGIRRAAAVVRTATDAVAAQRRVGLGEVALIACGMVLLSPQSSKAHFCIWLLPGAFLAAALFRRRDPMLWLLALLAFAVGTLTAKGVVGSALGNRLLAYGTTTWSTVLLALATVRALGPVVTTPSTSAPSAQGGR